MTLISLICSFLLAHAPIVRSYLFHHDGVLGTSVDFTFVTSQPGDAVRAERIALNEIERVRRLISTWDSTSEVSTLFRTGKLDAPSAELATVLNQYVEWNARSHHAYSARIGRLTQLWQDAAKRGVVPDSDVLAATVAAIASPAWAIDAKTGSISALTTDRVDLNSLGKGFVIDRVIRTVRDSVSTLEGALVNIGGDIRVWGSAPNSAAWRIAVANPRNHADNAVPLVQLDVRDAAVSSSGDYERGVSIGGTHYSHIMDPRTGYPARDVISATVIARDNATANALATTLSVLSPTDGVALIQTVAGASALLVTASGEVIRTPGFALHEVKHVAAVTMAAAFTATFAIDATPGERQRHSPYVAAWITDTAGRHVRTLAFWGNKPKYMPDMSRWWSANSSDIELVDAVTRATRPAGKYTLDWDGLDQKGAVVPAGTYVFWLEAAYEDGPHSSKSVAVACGPAHGAGSISSAAAFTGAEIACDPVKH